MLLSVFMFSAPGYCQENKTQAQLIEMLESQKQADRDAAAAKLRANFTIPKSSKWKKLLSRIHKGMTIDELEKTIDRHRRSGINCGGGGCTTGYRMDDYYDLVVGYSSESKKVFTFELSSALYAVVVTPPDNYSGKWVEYYVNGQKSEESNYKNGRWEGEVVSYHSNGKFALVKYFIMGENNGEERGYYPSGKISYIGQYFDGKPSGKWKFYKEDGTLSGEGIKGPPYGSGE